MGCGPEIAVDRESAAEPRLLGGGVRHREQQHRQRAGKYTLSSHNRSSAPAALISHSVLHQYRVKQGGGASLTSQSMLQQRITELDQQREELKIEVSSFNESYGEKDESETLPTSLNANCDYINIGAGHRLIAINRIQNKVFVYIIHVCLL